jgi:hypothetical protein
MDLSLTVEEAAFRDGCRNWLRDNLPWDYGTGLPPLFDDLAEAADVGGRVVVEEEGEIGTDRAADFRESLGIEPQMAHFVNQPHKGSCIGTAAPQSCLRGNTFLDNNLVAVEELENIEIARMGIECFIGFVDCVAVTRYPFAPLDGKSVTLLRYEGEGVVEMLYTHKP